MRVRDRVRDRVRARARVRARVRVRIRVRVEPNLARVAQAVREEGQYRALEEDRTHQRLLVGVLGSALVLKGRLEVGVGFVHGGAEVMVRFRVRFRVRVRIRVRVRVRIRFRVRVRVRGRVRVR